MRIKRHYQCYRQQISQNNCTRLAVLNNCDDYITSAISANVCVGMNMTSYSTSHTYVYTHYLYYTRTHPHIHARMHTHAHTHAPTHTHRHAPTRTHAHTHPHTCTHTHTPTHARTHARTPHTHTTHTCTHTHIHSRTCIVSCHTVTLCYCNSVTTTYFFSWGACNKINMFLFLFHAVNVCLQAGLFWGVIWWLEPVTDHLSQWSPWQTTTSIAWIILYDYWGPPLCQVSYCEQTIHIHH